MEDILINYVIRINAITYYSVLEVANELYVLGNRT